MSKSEQPPSENDDVDPDEQDLLDLAEMDIQSAEYARTVLIEEYDYSEEELP
jgi:hypothetical protein